MTESLSGFLGPEERAAFRLRQEDPAAAPIASDLSLTVLRFVAEHGPSTMSRLLADVQARPRSLVAAVDELEQAGLLMVTAEGEEETVLPTEAGMRAVAR
jgi:DNA-binding MarR family transcriptional regulator